MKKSLWEERKNSLCWGQSEIEREGFIHCSTVEYFWRVSGNFASVREEMVLIVIDEGKLRSEVRYEDGDNCARAYPHVYGLINNDAVKQALPYLRHADGTWIKNPELMDVPDR